MKAVDKTPSRADNAFAIMIQCPHCRRILNIALTEAD